MTSLSAAESSPSTSLCYADDDEVILEVPHEFMDFPLGFVVDSGGSLSKVIYRSKKDYKHGKIIKPSDHGLLRLKYFKMININQITDFLKENCDVNLTGNGCGTDGDDFTCYMTGVTTQHFKAELEKNFGVKIKLYSEMMAVQNFVKVASLLKIGCYDYDFEAFSNAANRLRILAQAMVKLKTFTEDSTFDDYKADDYMADRADKDLEKINISEKNSQSNSTFDSPLYELLSCSDEKKWADKYMKPVSDQLIAPSTFTMFGSASGTMLVNKDYQLKVVDLSTVAGKTLFGLMEELVGETDFDKFMDMAARGDLTKVTTCMSDLKNYGNAEEDLYGLLPDEYPAYELGKLTSANAKGKGSYTKEDLAAGILNFQANILSKFALHNTLIQQVDVAYFCGSVMKYELIRKMVTKHFLGDAFWIGLEKGNLLKPLFVRHPGFSVALGVCSAPPRKSTKPGIPKYFGTQFDTEIYNFSFPSYKTQLETLLNIDL
ncbi:hypothetical protein HELRODRAFT_159038 [Helobdella robusta]|uniref:Uncharacterized protein n=1 Tax=Helobdella robusta TaxID=6412 RepID=T1ENI4_HELRO|nr:hypothetical protein HELRODRAFT_159038 [Helobdella robusta]ESO12492.1 hypothetical protein HELRODRAFT_159038 [Helobdella robusta]